MERVYVGLGSNQGKSKATLQKALSLMHEMPAIEVRRCSSFYRSQPLGDIAQADFVNAVVEIATTLSPDALLAVLQQLEQRLGRVRTEVRWGPRVIDCDILLYGDQVIHSAVLTIPHRGLTSREFVLYPLAEIAPDLQLPTGETMAALKQQCPQNGLTLL